jgi:hypothetical protein
MITIFCDFCQVSARKLAFFSKTNVYYQFFAKTCSNMSKKTPIFSPTFMPKIFLIHNIGSRRFCRKRKLLIMGENPAVIFF